MKMQTRLLSLFSALAVVSAPMALADNNRTTATLVGAAVGGVVGNVAGNSTNATLLGAAAGGLLGILLSQNDSNYAREGYYRQHYYYGGRQFSRRDDYRAYREAAERGMLHDQERARYHQFEHWRDQQNHRRGHNRPQPIWQHQEGRGQTMQPNGYHRGQPDPYRQPRPGQQPPRSGPAHGDHAQPDWPQQRPGYGNR